MSEAMVLIALPVTATAAVLAWLAIDCFRSGDGVRGSVLATGAFVMVLTAVAILLQLSIG